MKKQYKIALSTALLAVAAGTGTASAATITASVISQAQTANDGSMGTIDLTAEGSIDWQSWSRPAGTLLTEGKSGGTAFGSLDDLGTHNELIYNNDGFTYSWTDGTTLAAGSDNDGVRSNDLLINEGWTIDVSVAAAGDYVLKFYGASNGSTDYQLDATLASDATTDSASDTANPAGVTEVEFTVAFTTDAADTLTLDFFRSSSNAGDTLTANAVTLALVPEPSSLALLGLGGLLIGRRRRG